MAALMESAITELINSGKEPRKVLEAFNNYYTSSTSNANSHIQNTFLNLAIRNRQYGLVRHLLHEGFCVNHDIWPASSCPLHIACDLGDESMIKLLLANGADVNLNVLCSLASNGHVVCSVAETILRHDDPKLLDVVLPKYDAQKSTMQWTLSHLAAKMNAPNCLKHTLQKSPEDVNSQDSQKQTPLFYAVQHNPKLVEILISHGADVNARDTDGWTALFQLLHQSCGSHGRSFISQSVPQTIGLLFEGGLELNSRQDRMDSLYYLCGQITAELQYRPQDRLQGYPYPINQHHDIVVKVANQLLIVDPAEKSAQQDISMALLANVVREIRTCCYDFPSHRGAAIHTDDLERAFDSFGHALCLARDLMGGIMARVTFINPSQDEFCRSLLGQVVNSFKKTAINVAVRQSVRWQYIMNVFHDIFHILILQYCPVPYQGSILPHTLAVFQSGVFVSPVRLLLAILPHAMYEKDRAEISTLFQGPRILKGNDQTHNLQSRELKDLCHMVILQSLHRPRLQHIAALPLPQLLKSFLSMDDI